MSKSVKKSKSFISLLLMTVLILSMSIPAIYAQAPVISDIQSHWAKNEVSVWVEQGFITGYSDGTFKPNNPITRAEFIALVNRVFAFSEKASVPFTDVKESDWFYADFAKASKAGYLGKYEDGKVVPNGFITRQEVAVISAKVKSMAEDAAAANGFADAAMIPSGSKGFVGAVVNAKVMNGYPNGRFEPANSITRAESVITLNRLMNLKATEQTVQIEAITDKSISVSGTQNVAVKLVPADAKLSAKSSDASIAEATLTGTNVQLKGIKIGTATITVTGKKDGMKDGVVTFKVTVGPKASGGGGGGSHHSNGGGSNPPANNNETKLTELKAVVGASTVVTGKYGSGVTKVEVIYNSTVVAAALSNGTFSCSITPGLAIGADISAKAYAGSQLLDTDTVKSVENESMVTEVKATGTTATEISGKYADAVTKVEVIYNGMVKNAELRPNGTFYWNIFPGLVLETQVTVKGYVGNLLVDTDSIKAGKPAPEPGSYLSNLQAVGTLATAVTGTYAEGVTKVEVLYNGLVKEAMLKSDKTFSWSIFPGLAGSTTVTVKAYVGAQLVETKTIVTAGGPVEGPFITNLKAVGTLATAVTGTYANGVTKVEVLYSGLVKEAMLKSDKTFSWSIFPGLAGGTTVTVKAYVGAQLVETKTVVTAGGPVEGPTITDVKAVGTLATAVSGKYTEGVTKVEVLYNNLTKTAMMNPDKTFSWSIFPGLAKGSEVIVKSYVGNTLKDTVAVNVQ